MLNNVGHGNCIIAFRREVRRLQRPHAHVQSTLLSRDPGSFRVRLSSLNLAPDTNAFVIKSLEALACGGRFLQSAALSHSLMCHFSSRSRT